MMWGTSRWRGLRLAVLDRDLWLCQIKGPTCTRYATEVDHIVARVDGGGDEPANLRASCRACNCRAGAERTNSRRQMAGYRTGVADYVTRF
jgi:5-methylcytosine-specific restriction endonuclease McrA